MRSLIIRVLVLPLVVSTLACESAIDNLPNTPDPITVTDTFTGSININGAATHNVFTGATGVVQATLTSLGENPPAKIGFSMGTLSGSTCSHILTNDNAVVTSVLTGSVTTLNGSLCVRVYDVGALTESVEYTFTVTHQ